MTRFNTAMYRHLRVGFFDQYDRDSRLQWFSRKSRIIVIRIFTEELRKSHISTDQCIARAKATPDTMARRAIDPLKRLKTLKTKIINSQKFHENPHEANSSYREIRIFR